MKSNQIQFFFLVSTRTFHGKILVFFFTRNKKLPGSCWQMYFDIDDNTVAFRNDFLENVIEQFEYFQPEHHRHYRRKFWYYAHEFRA